MTSTHDPVVFDAAPATAAADDGPYAYRTWYCHHPTAHPDGMDIECQPSNGGLVCEVCGTTYDPHPTGHAEPTTDND